jgi:hypothetical protein
MPISRRTFLQRAWTLTSVSAITTLFPSSFAKAQTLPKHLKDALEILSGLRPENNKYQNRPTIVTWKDKKIPCEQGTQVALDYKSEADCSGFINKLLCHSYNLMLKDLQRWMELGESKRPLAKHYHNVIVNQKHFAQITKLDEVQPGDIIAIKYLKEKDDDNQEDGKPATGHVMLVAGLPKKIEEPIKPTVHAATLQWEVMVIDQSKSGHGKSDSRYKKNEFSPCIKKDKDSAFYSGLGQGLLRVYTNEKGDIYGYTWSLCPTKEEFFYTRDKRDLVVGRLKF